MKIKEIYKNLLKCLNRREETPSFNMSLDYELEAKNSFWKQEREDREYENDIQRAAMNYVSEVDMLPTYNLGGKSVKLGIVLIKSTRWCYKVYNPDTAKYLNSDFNELVRQEIKKLNNDILGKYLHKEM